MDYNVNIYMSLMTEYYECFTTSVRVLETLGESHLGVVKFTNTAKRSTELINIIDSIIGKGSMTLVEAQRLRGRMQFMDGQLFGRLGRLCMREVTNHTMVTNSTKLSKRTVDAMRRFAIFLEHAEPRQLSLSSDTVWFIYTDACFEPTSHNWKCGLGGVLVNPDGHKVAFFSICLDEDQLESLGVSVKKTIIFEAELLALVVAFSAWRQFFSAKSMLCFIDNNSARDVAISGSGRNATANFLVEALLKLEMARKKQNVSAGQRASWLGCHFGSRAQLTRHHAFFCDLLVCGQLPCFRSSQRQCA